MTSIGDHPEPVNDVHDDVPDAVRAGIDVDAVERQLTGGWIERDRWFDSIAELEVAREKSVARVVASSARAGDTRKVVRRHFEALWSVVSDLGYDVRVNHRHHVVEIRPRVRGMEAWRRFDEGDAAMIADLVMVRVRFNDPGRWGKQSVLDSALALVADHEERGESVDPFIEWIREGGPWDGKPRLDSVLQHCGFIVADGAAAAVAVRYILIGGVVRSLWPGAKHDVLVLFYSRMQGIGKSLFLARLLPSGLRASLFNDDLDLSGKDTRSFAESVMGRVIVESAEVAGLKNAEVHGLKSQLSRSVYSYRKPYARAPSDTPATHVPVGTANLEEGKYLLPSDPTGYRRFYPLELESGDPEKVISYLRENRHQLWKEALYRVEEKGEEIPYADAAAAAAAEERSETLAYVNQEMEDVYAYFMDEPTFLPLREDAAGGGMKLGDMRDWMLQGLDGRESGEALLPWQDDLKKHHRNRFMNDMATVLKRHGWRNVRRSSGRLWYSP